MSRERALTLHSGFYPQLARGLTSKFSFTRSVGRSAGVHYKTLGSKFAEHVRELSEEHGGGNELLSAIQSNPTTPTLFAIQPQKWQLGLQAAAEYLGRTAFKEKRATTWKDFVGDVEKYKERHKKYSLRGNYVWYTARSTGPKDIAEAYVSKQNFNYDMAESGYQKYASATKAAELREWALKALGMDGPNQHLDQSTIQNMYDDAAEEVKGAAGDDGRITKAPKPKGKTNPRDFILDGKAVESTEQSGISHGLIGDFPIKGAKSGASEGEKNKMAKAWEDYMKDPVIKTWNDVTKRLMKGRSKKLGEVIEKSGAELRDELKNIKTTGKQGVSLKKKARLQAAVEMDDAFWRNIKHNIANEGANKYKGWVEGVTISDRDEVTGKRLYASTDIGSQVKKSWIKYSVKGVQILDAISHAHGFMETGNNSKQIANHYFGQQMNYAHGAVNNGKQIHDVNGITTTGISESGNRVRNRINTSVSKKYTEQVFQAMEKKILRGLRDSIVKDQSGIKSGLKKWANSDAQNLFWASPYVGLEEGLYISRK